jgi:hypothetical protein
MSVSARQPSRLRRSPRLSRDLPHAHRQAARAGHNPWPRQFPAPAPRSLHHRRGVRGGRGAVQRVIDSGVGASSLLPS